MNFTGINARNGKAMSGAAHLKQSITDILTTRVGTRVMRREYGSRLPELVDNPFGPELVTELIAATAEALERWEPRVKVDRVYIAQAEATGKIVLSLEGRILINDEPLKLEGIEIN